MITEVRVAPQSTVDNVGQTFLSPNLQWTVSVVVTAVEGRGREGGTYLQSAVQ